MRVTLVFWNIHKRPEAFESLVRLANAHSAHVLLVAEMPLPGEPGLNGDPTTVLLNALNRPGQAHASPEFRLISNAPTTDKNNKNEPDIVQVYSRLPVQTRWDREAAHKRYTLWKIEIPQYRPFHLAAAHFTSIQNDQGDGQRECAVALRGDLEQAERSLHSKRDAYKNLDPLSLVIGDLNANPFDAGIVGAYGLNATRFTTVAREGFRKHMGREYPYLYNPMWQFLNADPPGSFYDRTDAPVRFDWYVLDQVLVRPAFIELFGNGNGKEPDLRLLIEDGNRALTKGQNKTPNEAISDHLPLLFRFQLPE